MMEININALKRNVQLSSDLTYLGLIAKNNNEYVSKINRDRYSSNFETSTEIESAQYHKEFKDLFHSLVDLDDAFELCAVFTEDIKTKDGTEFNNFIIVDFAVLAPTIELLNNFIIPVNSEQEWIEAQKNLFKFGVYWKTDIANLNFDLLRIEPYNSQNTQCLCIKNHELCIISTTDSEINNYQKLSISNLEDLIRNNAIKKYIILKKTNI